MTSPDAGPSFDAFLSYHSGDEDWVATLKTALEAARRKDIVVSAEDPSNPLSVDDRLALLKIERREAGALRKAAATAWLSLGLASLLVGILVFGAWSQLRGMRREVADPRGDAERSLQAYRGPRRPSSRASNRSSPRRRQRSPR